jgi:malonate-semialdehyde dehydrogenase (acetylating)/methylmalonate-semialdehyde dehydrogenase
MTKQVKHFINGRRTAGRSGRSHAVYNPSTGLQSGSVDLAEPDGSTGKRDNTSRRFA